MPDLADMADDNIELELQSNIYLARKRVIKPLMPNKKCHNCGDGVAKDELFCPKVGEKALMSECQADFERRSTKGQK